MLRINETFYDMPFITMKKRLHLRLTYANITERVFDSGQAEGQVGLRDQ